MRHRNDRVVHRVISENELETKRPVFEKDKEFMKRKKSVLKEKNKETRNAHRMQKRLKSTEKIFSKTSREYVKAKVRSISTTISDRMESKLKFITGPVWCKKKAELFQQFVFSKSIAPLSQVKANNRFWEHYFELLRNSIIRKKVLITKKFSDPPKGFGPWKVLWNYKEHHIRDQSPYGHFDSLKIRPMIMKSGDDLRQELLALKLIRCFHDIFRRENLSAYLRPYDVIIRDSNSGFIGTLYS